MGYRMKLLILITALAFGTGCATAEQRMASKDGYRKAQVEAIKVQREADTQAVQALSAERVAMWEALGKAVEANPDAASHVAIVAAVASVDANEGGGTATKGNVVKLNTERETTALDYVKVLTPGLIGGVTQAGIAAIAAETTRESIQANRDIRIKEAEIDGKMWDVLTTGITEAGDGDNYYYVDDSDSSDADGTTDDADPVDDVDVPDTTPDEPPVVVDDEPVDDTTPDDTTDTTPDTTPDTADDDVVDDTEEPAAIDCSAVMFSPAPPECQSP